MEQKAAEHAMRDSNKPDERQDGSEPFCFSLVDVVINEDSGQARSLGREKIENLIRMTYGERVASIYFVCGSEIENLLREIISRGKIPAVLLGGGDGTVRSCSQLFLNSETHLGILPLGTMNLLAHDLGIPEDFETALKAYRNCEKTRIDSGMVNEHLFLCNAVIGVIPEASIAREEARHAPPGQSLLSWTAVLSTVFEGLHKNRRRRFIIRYDNKEGAFFSNALIIANNGYVRNPRAPHERLRRNTLTDGRLVVYSAGPASMFGSLRLLMRLLWGSWQKDPAVYAFPAKELVINDLHRYSLVSLDGEPIELQAPLRFSILPRSLPVIIPAIPDNA